MLSIPQIADDPFNLVAGFLGFEVFKLFKLTKEQHEYIINHNSTIEVDDKKKTKKMFGVIHCFDGPAIEYANGDKQWYLEGKLHRLDGPPLRSAIEYANGNRAWYVEGKLHRLDEPAIECPNDERISYYEETQLILVDGQSEWWVSGVRQEQ